MNDLEILELLNILTNEQKLAFIEYVKNQK